MTTATAPATRTVTAAGTAFAVLTGIATVFVFVQFFTSSEFIRMKGDTAETWTNIHGVTAYGLLVPALAAAIVAVVALRRAAPWTTALSVAFFLAAVGQWGTGHLISTLGMDGWTPFHVFFSSVVLALGIGLAVQSIRLRRA